MFAVYGLVCTGGKSLPNDAKPNADTPRIDSEVATFEDYVALRERWSRLTPTPKIVALPQQCRNIGRVPGSETRALLSPEETRARASAFFCGLEKGIGAAAHHQPSEDEFFIAFSGPLRLKIGNLAVENAEYGSFGFAPRYGTPTFAGMATNDMTLNFSMNSPGGNERGFEYGMTNYGKPRFFEGMEARGFVFHEPVAFEQSPVCRCAGGYPRNPAISGAQQPPSCLPTIRGGGRWQHQNCSS